MPNTARIIVALAAMIMIPVQIFAFWEAETRLGYDSNVNRSTDQEASDVYLDARAGYVRDSDPDRRFDWTLRAALEAMAYNKTSDLDALSASCHAGVAIAPSDWWGVTLEPFVQAKTVRDSDQSAWAFGGTIRLDQQWTPAWYSGAYYTYTDSRAREDTYSFTEHAAGVMVGRYWGGSFFSEIGYEYGYGPSFQTIPTTATTVTGSGRGYRYGYSTTFDAEVVQEDLTRHSGSLTIGYASGSLLPYASYRYSRSTSDLGTMYIHEAWTGLRYTF